MKIRKIHTRKRYRYSVNRKTLNKTRKSTGKIKDPALKKLWEEHKRPNRNFDEMGLSSDPNKAVPIPNFKQHRLQVAKIVNGFVEERVDDSNKEKDASKQKDNQSRRHRPKEYVAQYLEEQANAPRESELRLPKGVISLLIYFLDNYKFNYKAMVSDRRNHDQWTWKQFRMKIRKFISIPVQFDKYLEKLNMQAGAKLDWPEYDSDSEWK